MNDTIIGIDPGLSGGIALLEDDGHYFTWKMMDAREMFQLLTTKYNGFPSLVFVENVNAGPKMGSSAAFKFGKNVGMINALCIAAKVRVEYVSPQKWQRELGLIVKGRGLGQNDTAKKNRNKQRAQELFPNITVTHANADALLIAEFGRRMT